MTVTVVGVHGINCLRYYQEAGTPEGAAALMAAGWTTALAEGAALAPRAAADRLAVAYYSQLLAKKATAQGADTDFKWLTDGERSVLMDLVRDLGAPPQVAQGPGTIPLRQAGQWFARRYPTLATSAVARFCHEVEAYLGTTDSPRRAAVRDAVAATIAARRPRAVIAHSLGSVVAYETLWHRPDLKVDLLLTIGSPLGMPHVIQDRLDPRLNHQTGRGAIPPGVTTWLNVADKGDLVASPISLEETFDGVTQLPGITIGAVTFHTATAYLRHPEVAARIAPYLSG